MVLLAGMAHLALPASSNAQPQPTTLSSAPEDSLKRFLQDYLRENNADSDKTTRYLHTFVDLNGDGRKEAIVYLVGRGWCGSGGCVTLILARKGESFRVITWMTITRP